MGSSTGLATMVALDSTSANAIWRREFERFSAGQERWISGGPTVWHAAHLTTRDRQDVVLTLRRSRMHSEETFALSGESGKTIWHRDKQIADRSFGGQPFAIADYDEDGLEDLASFYTHIRYVTDGATGKDLLAKENYWSEVPISPVYWGQPVAGQFGSALNKNSLLFTTDRRQMIGLVQLDGELAWSDAYDKAANGYPAIGDFDGDQQVEAIFVGFEDGTRCYHLATGDQLWSLPLGANRNVESAVSGDLDGDGLDEAVFALGDTLYCLGFDSTTNRGQVEWSIRLPSTVSSPIIADIQSPGDRGGDRLVVLVCGRDGVVYCVDNTEP